jgi:hypothetical protein
VSQIATQLEGSSFMPIPITYGDFLPNVSQTWEFVDLSNPRARLNFDYRVLVPPSPQAESARIVPSGHEQRFWFTEWAATDEGLFLNESQAGNAALRANPPLKLTFNSAERNFTERLYPGPITGMDNWHDGLVVEKQLMSFLSEGEPPPPRWEWKLRIQLRGNLTRAIVVDVTMRLEAGTGILEFYGQCYGVWFILKRPWLVPIEVLVPPSAQPLPSPPPVVSPPPPRHHGGGGGTQTDTFPDPAGRRAKELWDAELYVDQWKRENEWRKEHGMPLRGANSYEKRSLDLLGLKDDTGH